MQQKKGQAAMEFLMTYGWAILAAIVAIGVLAYFGVFSPGKLTGSSQITNNPFYASASQVDSVSNTIKLELTNNGGDTAVISEISVTGTGASAGIICSVSPIPPAGDATPGRIILFTTNICAPILTSGNNFAGDIKITYKKQGSTLNQISTGTLRGMTQ
ncbi:MAG: hypothetical protein AABX96_02945 [Nanoarchaeota archaeon]